MNILIIIIAVLLLAAQRNGGIGGGAGGGGTPPPPCSDSKFARMQAYIWLLRNRGFRSFIDLQQRAPSLAAVLQREYGDCRGWNNW